MRGGALLLAIAVGVLLRVAAIAWHDQPQGDVLLDTGVARSLLAGEGFHAGFERGTALVRGDGPIPPQDMADQHPPLWPLLGAALGLVAGWAFGGLKLASLLAGLLVLLVTWRIADRLVEGVPGHPKHLPALATALVALSFLMIEFSADGALYGAQALLVLLLAHRLGRAQPGVLAPGLLLGAAWLLNHQAAVLLPVPALVLAAGSEPGRRARGAAAGLAIAAVACLVVAPWWWRNSQVFGDPFFSTNGFYALNKAGIEPVLSIEASQPVARFPDVPLWRTILSSQRAWLPPNVLYLAVAGLLLWPGLLGVVAAGLPALVGAAWRGRDRRLLALLACAAAQLAVALAWPDMKLRYLVPLTPLVVLLGVRLQAAAPTRGERRLAWVVAGGWALLLAATWNDFAGTGSDPRPARWILLAAGGPVLLLVPLLLRHVSPRVVGAGLRTALVTGLLAVPLLTLAALLPPPHTCYNGCALLPDIFGQPKDLLDRREAGVLDLARAAALRDGAGVACGPETLLAWSAPGLIKLPYGGAGFADAPLAALIDAQRCDHVITLTEPPWPIELAEGQMWLDGRLQVITTCRLQEGGEDVAAALVARPAAMSRGWAPWLVLFLLLVVYPAIVPLYATVWAVHALAVSVLLLLAVPRLWRTPLLRAGVPALCVGLALLSLAVALARAPEEAPRAEQRWAALTGALHALVFLLALGWLPGPEVEGRRVRRTALALCALLLALCAVQVVGGVLAAPWDEPDPRLAGTLGNPNTLGALLAASTLVVLGTGQALARDARVSGATPWPRRPLLIAGLLAVPLLGALLATRSRGAVAALLVTLLLLALRWRRLRLLAAVAAAALLVVLVPNPLRERLAHMQPDHVYTRPFLWSVAVDIAAEHPAGFGPAMFKYEFPARALDPERPWLVHQRHAVGLAHNVFLTLAIEWGWLACAALLALLGWSALRLLAGRDGRLDPLRLGATLGACVLLVELQVDGIEQNPLAFTVFLLLVAAALARLPRAAGLDVPGRVVALACLLAGLAAGGLAAWRAAGYLALSRATTLAESWVAPAREAPVRTAFDAAAAALPGELAPPRSRLEFERRVLSALLAERPLQDPHVQAAIVAAHAAVAACRRANGLDPDVRWQGADLDLMLYRRSREPALLAGYVEQASAALRLDPLDVDGHFDLAQEAQRAGRRALADREFEALFRLEPDHALAWLVRARQFELDGEDEAALYAWVRTEEALLNDRVKAGVDSPRSREFFEDMLRRVNLEDVRGRIVALRRKLYF